MGSIRLGVNIDHVATLREVRKSRYPDIVEAMFLCERGGADQITVHLREDRRHIQDEDLDRLLVSGRLPINLEMAFMESMVKKAQAWKPFGVTLVPERREEMTTESGLDLKVVHKKTALFEQLLKCSRVYAFIDPDLKQVRMAKDLGFDGIEFHTGPYCHAYEASLRGRSDKALKTELETLHRAAEEADRLKLEVKAGHGLTLQNVQALLSLKGLSELNIGHAIVCRSIVLGLEGAVREMKTVISRS